MIESLTPVITHKKETHINPSVIVQHLKQLKKKERPGSAGQQKVQEPEKMKEMIQKLKHHKTAEKTS